ncbi:gamma carbonic anhydrase family protein [Pseudorhodoferax sp.]|uniref:gamma carbonic anhydrase family protein n=1 Tax=Pseudorhodoferax sp. TaxID=1993553 RepID=UPI0039E528BF
MAVYRLNDLEPHLGAGAYVAEDATVIGAVTIGTGGSVWPQSVLRADNEPITIGEASNIQDGAVLHTDPGFPLRIGNQVSVGHQAMLHGCSIGDGSLIGIQAVVLNGAVIGRNCLVAAGAVVLGGKEFPDNSLIVGAPAKLARQLSDAEVAGLRGNAADYAQRAAYYQSALQRLA